MKNINFQRQGAIGATAIWVGIFALVLVSIWAMVKFGGNGSNVGGTALLSEAISAADNSKGASNPSITLVEYGDYQCPACSAYHKIVERLTEEAGDNLTFVYRHFPLSRIHSNAEIAAYSAEAAARQDKFWDMHNMIYENQSEWANQPSAKEIFEGYATILGLDLEKFKQDRDSEEVRNKVEADFESGVASRVNGTPTFYLNGKKIDNPQGYTQFMDLILAELPEEGGVEANNDSPLEIELEPNVTQ